LPENIWKALSMRKGFFFDGRFCQVRPQGGRVSLPPQSGLIFLGILIFGLKVNKILFKTDNDYDIQ